MRRERRLFWLIKCLYQMPMGDMYSLLQMATAVYITIQLLHHLPPMRNIKPRTEEVVSLQWIIRSHQLITLVKLTTNLEERYFWKYLSWEEDMRNHGGGGKYTDGRFNCSGVYTTPRSSRLVLTTMDGRSSARRRRSSTDSSTDWSPATARRRTCSSIKFSSKSMRSGVVTPIIAQSRGTTTEHYLS